MTEKEEKKEKGEISRREFLKDAGLLVGGTAIGSTVLLAACAGETETETLTKTVTSTATTTIPGTTTTVTKTVEVPFVAAPSAGYLVYDSKKCCSCRSCMSACSLAHEGVANLSLSRIQIVFNSLETFPDDIDIAVCRQCVYPACVDSCPTEPKALHVDTANGNIRTVDESLCIGCMQCIDACPYIPHRTIWNPTKTNAIGIKGVAVKCDLCADTPYWDETGGVNGRQACVEVCPLDVLRLVKEVPSQRDTQGYDVNLRNEESAKAGLSPDW